MLAGYEPVNIQAESRARCISALRSFQLEDDPLPFVAFFCLNLRDRLSRTEQLLSGETERKRACTDQLSKSSRMKRPKAKAERKSESRENR